MRFKSVDIIYNSATALRDKALEMLSTDPTIRQLIAKMARSEVKNYLAELAEEAELPFGNPASFLRNVGVMTRGVTQTRDPDVFVPVDDTPYTMGHVNQALASYTQNLDIDSPDFGGITKNVDVDPSYRMTGT